jgi:Doubled CXXCH motif (Paired_CXXCH_1)
MGVAMRITRLVVTALSGVVLSAGAAFAFHDGGVAECSGCHTMHNSQDGVAITDAGGHQYLLKAANATDACLNCHAAYGQFLDGTGYGPGGDFYWLTKTFSWSAHGHTTTSTGDSHGHNVISPSKGVVVDAVLGSAPGGDFDSDRLGCTSCHNPHGNQNFRLLYGSDVGPLYPGGPGGRYPFTSDAPLAIGNSRVTTQGGSGEETDSQHTIYKSGVSDWCANCHTNFHSDNTTDFVHPIETLGGLADAYNAYVSTDDPTGGDQATSYWGLVPFEAVNVDFATADPADYTMGPNGNDRVMCLTCHRAHASAFPDAGRWDFGVTFIEESHPMATDTGATQADSDNKYYDYTFATNQRSLCNKCHTKDTGDAPL